MIRLGYFDRHGVYHEFDFERRLVPEKEEAEPVEPEEENGTIDSINLTSGIGFIVIGTELVGFSLDTQWIEMYGGAIIPQKGDLVKFIRETGTKSPRVKYWWFVKPSELPRVTQKPAAQNPPQNQNAKWRIMRQVPGEKEEIVYEGSFWEVTSVYARRPSANQDPLNELRSAVRGLQPKVWFATDSSGTWQRRDDPRPPFREEKPRMGPRRKKIHRS